VPRFNACSFLVFTSSLSGGYVPMLRGGLTNTVRLYAGWVLIPTGCPGTTRARVRFIKICEVRVIPSSLTNQRYANHHSQCTTASNPGYHSPSPSLYSLTLFELRPSCYLRSRVISSTRHLARQLQLRTTLFAMCLVFSPPRRRAR
jgi:hypothetical protein